MRVPSFLAAAPRAALRAPLLIIAAACIAWIPWTAALGPWPTMLWRGYQTLLVRGDIADAGALETVVARLGPGVVSSLTATADFWDFTGLARIPYADIDRRLDRLDPRRDTYIDGALGYFRAAGRARWQVAYVPATSSSALLFLRTARALGLPVRGEWRLVDFDPLIAAAGLAALLAMAVLNALSLSEGRRPALAAAVAVAGLWIPFLLCGGLARFALSLAAVFAWFPLLRERVQPRSWEDLPVYWPRQPHLRFLVVAAACLVLSVLSGGFTLPSIGGICAPLAASLLLARAIPAVQTRRAFRRSRAVFSPIPIVRPLTDGPWSRSVRLSFGAASLLLLGVLAISRGPSLPTPAAVAGAHDFGWSSVGRLDHIAGPGRLPDYAALVTHVAWEESLTFGRPWRTPVQDERVYVRTFLAGPAGGPVTERLKTVKVFDGVWLESVTRRAVPGSLEALLLSQGRPVAVTLTTPPRRIAADLPAAVLVLAAFLGMLGKGLGLRPLIRGNLLRLNGVARRNQAP